MRNSETAINRTRRKAEFARSLGNRISECAKTLGTRKQAASIIGVSVAQLGRYIAGENSPPVDVVASLARSTGVMIEWLVTGEGEKEKPRSVSQRLARVGLDDAKLILRDGYGVDLQGDIGGRAPSSIPVVGLAECGLKSWYHDHDLAVRATRPGDLMDPQAFAVMATGTSMVPAGINPGFMCLCSPAAPVDPGDAVYLRTSDRRAAIKLFARAEPDWLVLKGWLTLDPGETVQPPYEERVKRSEITLIAPVIYVKRKL